MIDLFFLQIQSFEAEISVPHVADKEGGPPGFRGVFIRAPAILEVGSEVEILAEVPVPDKLKTSEVIKESQKVSPCNLFLLMLNIILSLIEAEM